MDTYLFFLRVNNDVDQIAPVVWKMGKLGYHVRIIFLDKNANMDIRKDVRFRFLREAIHCPIEYYYAASQKGFRLPNRPVNPSSNPVLKKLARLFLSQFQKNICTEQWALDIMENLRPKVCVFDPLENNPADLEMKFLKAAKKLGIPVLSLPHGVHYITSYGNATEMIPSEKDVQKVTYHLFDKIVETSPYHLFFWDHWRVDRRKIKLLGSARYCPEWQEASRALWPPFSSKATDKRQLKVLFFLPRWEKTVDKQKTLEAIEKIIALPNIQLIIKEHTREGAGTIPAELVERLNGNPNVLFIKGSNSISFGAWFKHLLKKRTRLDLIDSVCLIKWADVCINFRSSISFEVLCQQKTLINPTYLHTNVTIFEEMGAGINAKNLDELLKSLTDLSSGQRHNSGSLKDFFKQTIYGGNEPHDVLASYCDLIVSMGKGA